MTTRLVSVLIPVWNSERWIEAAMTSMLAQTWRELELVVVDDASTDRTPEIIASFRDSRVRLVRREHAGGTAGRALNTGLALCQGELVARLDADDVSFSHRLATQVAHLDANPDIALLGSNMHILDARGRTLGRAVMWHGRELSYALHLGNVMFHPSIIVRREAFPATGYPAVNSRSEDWMLYLAVIRAGYRVDNLDERLGIYRRHPEALTSGPPRVTVADELRDHLRVVIDLEARLDTVCAWCGPYTVGDVSDPLELAEVARRLSPEALPARVLAHCPSWTGRGLRRARRAYVRHLVNIIREAARARRFDVASRLVPMVPGATLRALPLPRGIAP